MLNFKKILMKTIKNIIITCCALATLISCDKGFEELNRDPNAIYDLDPAFILGHTQQSVSFGAWESEATIAQYFQNAYDLGGTAGFQFNQNIDGRSSVRWNNYTGPIKNLVQALANIGDNPERTNLKSIMRIWKAYIFMNMVDSHGDVPYTDAGRVYLDGILEPRYDDDALIYEDLYKEIKEASLALNPAGDVVKGDLLYGGNITKWKRMANSLLLRLGMRYSKLDATKAAGIVQEAYNAGVMQTNDDDCILFYTTLYTNAMNNLSNNNPFFYYLSKPLVDQLKLTEDPRSKYIAGKYPNPNDVLNNPPDVTLSAQQGFPVGHSNITVASLPDYPGLKEGGLDYTQPNYFAMFSLLAPRFYLTNSQTKLLLAEAAYRGWITGDPQAFYEEGIRASMDLFGLYPGPYAPISDTEKDDYISHPNVAYNNADALNLINTQYWVSNVNNPLEGWSNFRRTGYPTLSPNLFNDNLNGGFVRRLAHPTVETGANAENYTAAQIAMGITGSVNPLTVRVFWDVEE
jgi:hypothetical protein